MVQGRFRVVVQVVRTQVAHAHCSVERFFWRFHGCVERFAQRFPEFSGGSVRQVEEVFG